jgi:nitrate/nitrite transport system substrate-binding protein
MKIPKLHRQIRTWAVAALIAAGLGSAARAEMLDVEKDELTFGFIKLTDCAPLVVAKELGYFEEEGLFVNLEAQANWKVLLDRVITGTLDGAHMLAGQPIAATYGFGTQADIVVSYSLDYNGNGITVSNDLWEKMKPAVPKDEEGKPIHPISAESLVPIAKAAANAGTPLKMGMVFPVSTHNYEIRYWLAAAGIRPGFYFDPETGEKNIPGVFDAQIELSVTPPPQIPSTLEAGTISGYCVGEPWNQQAVFKKIGVPVVTNYEIWKNNPEKVFGVTKKWAEENPNTWTAVTKALIRAGAWLDASEENRKEACKMLSMSNYVGADYEVIANSMTGTFEFEPGDKREMPDFNVFFRYNASYPWYSDCIWFLTQMRRWGQITEDHPDDWYFEMAKKIYRPDVYKAAALSLIDDGHFTEEDFVLETDGFRPPTTDFIDHHAYDGRKPNEYVKSFEIGLK